MRIPTLDIDNLGASPETKPDASKLAAVGQMMSALGTIIMCLLALAFLAVVAWLFFG